MLRKLFLHEANARFDAETVKNIGLFIAVDYYAAKSICFGFNYCPLNLKPH